MIHALFAAADEDVERARRLLDEAVRAETPRTKVGARVDKYFGTRLPPVCARLGCYITDDGKRFYCVNPSCQKHRKRATKHTKVRRKGEGPTYFKCPRCGHKDVELVALNTKYHCRTCDREWPVTQDR